MKLASLNAFVAAVKTGSLRGAARQLGVSQPGLTKLIRELEVELAAPLLLRTRMSVDDRWSGTPPRTPVVCDRCAAAAASRKALYAAAGICKG